MYRSVYTIVDFIYKVLEFTQNQAWNSTLSYVSAYIAFTRHQLSLSQWPRGLSNEVSSLARTLGSLVQIPLEVLMFVCIYSVCR
jgi:hypothetical protein